MKTRQGSLRTVITFLGVAVCTTSAGCADSSGTEDEDGELVDAAVSETDTPPDPDPGLSQATDPFAPVTTPTLPASAGSTFYASPSGGGTGASASSPLTLAGAMSKAGPGSTIIVLPGSYGAYTWPSGKNGTSTAPITLKAQTRAITITNHVPQKAATSARAKFGKISLTGTKFVRIDGVHTQSVWMSNASSIEVRNAYVFGDAPRGMSVAGSSHVMIHDSPIENFAKSPTNSLAWYTDYGVFFYPGTDFDLYNNVWNGGFNHAISTKTSTRSEEHTPEPQSRGL